MEEKIKKINGTTRIVLIFFLILGLVFIGLGFYMGISLSVGGDSYDTTSIALIATGFIVFVGVLIAFIYFKRKA
tara:strand:+ start:2841 stop:3062 length:222 start_codon:yes stop_codon:yes gene_type:complete